MKRLGTRVTRGAGRGTAAAAVAIGGAALVAPAAEAATFTVENTNDAGPDSHDAGEGIPRLYAANMR